MKKVLLTLGLMIGMSIAAAQPFVWQDAWTASNPGDATAGGVLRDSSTSGPRTLNPFVSAEQNAILDVTDDASPHAASLLIQGPTSDEWLAYGASEYTVSEDGTVVDLTLRDGMRWSDGTPITVQDYYFRYLAETDPDVGSNAYDSWFIGDSIIEMEVTGENTLQFRFPAPDRTAFPVIAMVPAPDHILGEIYRNEGAEGLIAVWGTETDVAETVWSSAFVPVSYTPDERVVFERNEYWGEWNVDEAGNPLPYLDGIQTAIVESGDAALNLYLAGELDVFSPRTLDDIGVINVAVNNGDIDAEVIENASPVASSQFIVWNWNKSSDPFKQDVFRSAQFRRAMSHLVDRDALVELVYGGAASPMWSNVYQVLDYWVNPDVPKFPYDPEAALELLGSIGFNERNADGFLVDAEGNELGFTLATNAGNSEREQIAQIFADTARDAGVNVEVQALDFNLLVDQLLSTGEDRPFDAILIGLRGGSRDWPFGSNVIPCGTNLHAWNQAPDCLFTQETLAEELYYEGRQTLDTAAAREIGFEIQNTLASLQPLVYTVSPSAHYSYVSSLQGIHPPEFINAVVGLWELPLVYKAP